MGKIVLNVDDWVPAKLKHKLYLIIKCIILFLVV